MKIRLVPVLWAMVGAAVLAPATTRAQMPFSSTQAPGLNPFGRSGNNSLPVNTPSPRASTNQTPPGYANYPGATATVTGPIDPDHRLGPRDVLSYRVAQDRDERDTQLVVTDSGEVQLPLGGLRVKASGKTTQQLAGDIKAMLEREYYYPGHATVSLGLIAAAQGTSKGKVYLTGEVAGRGAIDLPADGELTVVHAILQAGGFTAEADLKGVFILRKGGPKDGLRVNAKAVLDGETDKDMVLQPGDTVKVKRRLWDFQM